MRLTPILAALLLLSLVAGPGNDDGNGDAGTTFDHSFSTAGQLQDHSQRQSASANGRFLIIEVPTSSSAGYVQLWSFPSEAAWALGREGLELIAELPVPLIADSLLTGSYEPLRP